MSKLVLCKRCVWYIPINGKQYGWCKRQTFRPERPVYKSPNGYCDKGEKTVKKNKGSFMPILRGRGEGKTLAAAQAEVLAEMSVNPPVSKEEAEAFLRVQIKRCRMNLANAKDRGDTRAQSHLERKLAVYEYLNRVITSQVNVPREAQRECPECKVVSVDIFGHCSCCGKNW